MLVLLFVQVSIIICLVPLMVLVLVYAYYRISLRILFCVFRMKLLMNRFYLLPFNFSLCLLFKYSICVFRSPITKWHCLHSAIRLFILSAFYLPPSPLALYVVYVYCLSTTGFTRDKIFYAMTKII